MSSSFLLPLWETLQHWQVGPTLPPFRLLLLRWVPEQVKLYVCALRVESVFSTASGSLNLNFHWPSILGACLPKVGPLC